MGEGRRVVSSWVRGLDCALVSLACASLSPGRIHTGSKYIWTGVPGHLRVQSHAISPLGSLVPAACWGGVVWRLAGNIKGRWCFSAEGVLCLPCVHSYITRRSIPCLI